MIDNNRDRPRPIITHNTATATSTTTNNDNKNSTSSRKRVRQKSNDGDDDEDVNEEVEEDIVVDTEFSSPPLSRPVYDTENHQKRHPQSQSEQPRTLSYARDRQQQQQRQKQQKQQQESQRSPRKIESSTWHEVDSIIHGAAIQQHPEILNVGNTLVLHVATYVISSSTLSSSSCTSSAPSASLLFPPARNESAFTSSQAGSTATRSTSIMTSSVTSAGHGVVMLRSVRVPSAGYESDAADDDDDDDFIEKDDDAADVTSCEEDDQGKYKNSKQELHNDKRKFTLLILPQDILALIPPSESL